MLVYYVISCVRFVAMTLLILISYYYNLCACFVGMTLLKFDNFVLQFMCPFCWCHEFVSSLICVTICQYILSACIIDFR